MTRAVILANLGAAAQAETDALAVLDQSPDDADAHFFLAGLYLSQQRFEAGWREYRWRPARVRSSAERGGGTELPLPLESFRGRPIVLYGEQGLGDTMFFLRFASALMEIAGDTVLIADPRLAGVLPWSAGARTDGAFPVMVGDLPVVLGTSTAPPLALRADPARIAAMGERLSRLPRPWIGVTWEGGVHPREQLHLGEGLFKRVDPRALGECFNQLYGSLISLQRNPVARDADAIAAAAGQPLRDFSDVNRDLADALALLHLLDEYVAVSNTNVHLHAGLGRASRVLVTHPCEWRWSGGERSPWFPEAVLYRQDPAEGWRPALAKLRDDLASAHP